jgi:regulator of replication initiation timing
MKQRMGAEERKMQLLKIMRDLYSKSHKQADLTAEIIAKESGVTSVWVYRLIGKELKELRCSLPGSQRFTKTIIKDLRSKITELEKQLSEMRTKYEEIVEGDIAGAIHHIEMLDEENRALRGRVALLEKRLAESEIVILPVDSSSEMETKSQYDDGSIN